MALKQWLVLLKREEVHLALLFFASLFLFLLQLGSTSLWDNSEPTYAEISREILTTGDWLTLHFNGQNWYVHPPLYFWLTAVGIKLFGLTEFVVRFWSAFFGACGILATYFLGKSLYNSRVGIMSSLVLLTTLEYMILSRIVLMDTLLNFFTLLAITGFILAYQKKESRYFLLFYLGSALAILSKGPVGIVLPLMVIVPFLLIRKEFSFLLRFLYWPGLALFVALLSPWYLSQILMHGKEFLMVNIAHYTFTRYLGVVENQPGPVYYYIPVLLIGFFPWVVFLPWVIRHLWKNRRGSASLFLLMGVSIIFIFFSLSGTKQPNYIITFLPLASIATAQFFLESLESSLSPFWKNPLWQGGFATLILSALFTIAGFLLAPSLPKVYSGSAIFLLPLGILWISGAIFYLLALGFRNNILLPFFVSVASVLVLFAYLIFGLFPEVEQYKYTKPFSLYIREHSRQDLSVVGYPSVLPSTLYYSDGKAQTIDNSGLKKLLSQKSPFYLITDEDHYKNLNPSDFRIVRNIATGILAAPVYLTER